MYHAYQTEIANECLLGEYGVASQVVHLTSTSVLGPWTRVGVALAGFAHNPQALLAPNGSVLLFHIGEQLAPVVDQLLGAGQRCASRAIICELRALRAVHR